MNEIIVIWIEVIAYGIIALYAITDFIVNKHDNKIIMGIKLLVVAVVLTIAFCAFLYTAIIGTYLITWISYAIIVVAAFLLLLPKMKYLENLKKATIIIKKKIWASN